jgi:hypothetical protein
MPEREVKFTTIRVPELIRDRIKIQAVKTGQSLQERAEYVLTVGLDYLALHPDHSK